MSVKTELFSPLTIKNVTLKNRIVMSPMCMYSCENEDGMVNDWHLTHYTSRAVGQTGLIVTEAVPVTRQGQISPQDLGIWSDDHIPGLKKLTTLIKKHGAKTAVQLGHAGRKAIYEGETIAPSAIGFDEKAKVPAAMTEEQIRETIEAFRDGARRARESGFDIIEIHGAHGYLISQFLSPLSNSRTDSYGGSLKNRFRFLKEVTEEVKKEWDGPLFVRISADEYHPDGNQLQDFVQAAEWLKALGVDLIDCSTGGIIRTPISVYPGYQLRHSETIRRDADIMTGAVGLITSGTQAEEILQNGRADLVFIGRALLRDPYWARSAARELNADIEPPKQYGRSW
ncbi:NADPH dehydrogenase NamA [Alteribacter natronophilus]|uniref:NADPH dehydrogenase NamA n=1 Tax=Alteribacter natronophilus TaxID=2583810 RepID=UPI00110E6039|nr:NADPH dehydrogenase NamA [Alteribacter natronophilus]TMW73713.1 NADPH dehydrogenase NamA [Alteribacter natronophilus]